MHDSNSLNENFLHIMCWMLRVTSALAEDVFEFYLRALSMLEYCFFPRGVLVQEHSIEKQQGEH